MVNRNYVLGLMLGYLPKDVNLTLVNTADGMPLQRTVHDKLVHALENLHHVPVKQVVTQMGNGEGVEGEIQFTTGLAHDKAGGLRFASDLEEPDVVVWISYED